MAEATRWGVIGTGRIAAQFVSDLRLDPDAEVVAVGSRHADSAEAFGQAHGIPHWHASYADLVADPGVEVVYVAVPHSGHHAATLEAIAAGKAVLCEKPFAINATEAREMVAAAGAAGTFLMEAMWTRFLPHVVRLRELLAEDAIGEVRAMYADHGQHFTPDPAHRLFDPALGGGALLDLGVYPVSFASMVLGAPASVTAIADLAMTGVDAQTSAVLRYSGGAHALLTTTLAARTPCRAWIAGSEGRIDIDPVFYAPTRLTLTRDDGHVERFEAPRVGHGIRYQAGEVTRCLRAGLTESPVMPWAESVSIMSTMDEIRRQVGVRYPMEGTGQLEA